MIFQKLFMSGLVATGLSAFGLSAQAIEQNRELPVTVQDALKTALDDEYKAYATYQAVMEKFGEQRPFSNIIHAEERHAGRLIDLMNKYGLEVPLNKYIKNGRSIVDVPNSVKEACEIGVGAEIENVALYDEKLLPDVKDFTDISFVMQNLRDASQYRHLRAFERCVARGGQMGRGRPAHGRGEGYGRGHRYNDSYE